MLNDKKASELLSRSLSGDLDIDAQRKVSDSLASSPQSANFARLSKLIQDSLSDVAHRSQAGDVSVAPGMDEAAKQRLKEKLRQESARLSLASGPTVPTPPPPAGQLEPTIADTGGSASDADEYRQMTSRFTLLRKLGEGGLGTVWLARDEKLNRTVALKEIHPEAVEFPRAWERFRREAEITGHLEHPNVVPLYQFGMDSRTGAPFYAMRFVGKRTLVDAIEEYHDRRRDGEDVTMDLHRLLSAFIGVCQAIAYAHSRGVIHRDLKPENVALDNFGQVIVLDWGLARVRSDVAYDAGLPSDVNLSESALQQTMAGEVIGTPLYMAPEQAAGDQDRIDERTDVWGLGAILFAMLTGVAPHQKSSQRDGKPVAVPELLKRISEDSIIRPRDVVDDIPSDLEDICRRAMHPKPHSRFQSATEVADAVQRWMAGRSERRRIYANCRSECREIRTAVQSAVRDLERNARFMASLPPIQGIIDSLLHRGGDDLPTWRERLKVIFSGLLRTNTDFCSISFSRVDSDTFSELLRIERQRSDDTNIRSIPTSRLATGAMTNCMKSAIDGHPDEVHIALASECPGDPKAVEGYAARLAGTIPVFDEITEELFGFVMIETCLARLMDRQVRARLGNVARLYVLDNDCRVLMHFDNNGTRVRTFDGQAMSCVTDCWEKVLQPLKTEGEFIDEQDHAVYATRIDLVPGRYSLAMAMCLAAR